MLAVEIEGWNKGTMSMIWFSYLASYIVIQNISVTKSVGETKNLAQWNIFLFQYSY